MWDAFHPSVPSLGETVESNVEITMLTPILDEETGLYAPRGTIIVNRDDDPSIPETNIPFEIPSGTVIIDENGDPIDMTTVVASSLNLTTKNGSYENALHNQPDILTFTSNGKEVGWIRLATGEFTPKLVNNWDRNTEVVYDDEHFGFIEEITIPEKLANSDARFIAGGVATRMWTENFIPSFSEVFEVGVYTAPDRAENATQTWIEFQYGPTNEYTAKVLVAGYKNAESSSRIEIISNGQESFLKVEPLKYLSGNKT